MAVEIIVPTLGGKTVGVQVNADPDTPSVQVVDPLPKPAYAQVRTKDVDFPPPLQGQHPERVDRGGVQSRDRGVLIKHRLNRKPLAGPDQVQQSFRIIREVDVLTLAASKVFHTQLTMLTDLFFQVPFQKVFVSRGHERHFPRSQNMPVVHEQHRNRMIAEYQLEIRFVDHIPRHARGVEPGQKSVSQEVLRQATRLEPSPHGRIDPDPHRPSMAEQPVSTVATDLPLHLGRGRQPRADGAP